MRAYVHPTDADWSSYLRARPHLDEVNFWVPSGTAFRALSENEPFLFKSKAAAGNRMIGGGLYSGSNAMKVSEAWDFFGEGNGGPSEAHLLEQINRYRARNGAPPEADPTIGCILLREVFFVPEFAELPPPPDYRGPQLSVAVATRREGLAGATSSTSWRTFFGAPAGSTRPPTWRSS